MASLFSEDFSSEPYWWDATPRPVTEQQELPSSVDVLVIGAGYTGLHAALQTARAGRSTAVIDAEAAGWGCSSRNGGQISTSLKPNYDTLVKKYGASTGLAIALEGHLALRWIEEFVTEEHISCNFQRNGRFHAAHSSRAFAQLKDKREAMPPGIEDQAVVIERKDQHRYIGSDAYHGGIFHPNYASLDPAKYHAGLLQRTINAGVEIHGHCAAKNIKASGDKYKVQTARGEIIAKDVVIATNGYTGSLTPWLQRRIIPIGSYIITTEAVPAELMQQLLPQQINITDSRKVVYYYRTSPDNKRIIFGGRVSHGEVDTITSAHALHRDLAALFPALQNTQISHSWKGTVAYTFDELPHMGRHDGLHYAMGYCGSGVSLSSYLGMKLGLQVACRADNISALNHIKHPTRPLYRGNPWFLAPSVAYYRWRDKHS